jgi:hypothetical protein
VSYDLPNPFFFLPHSAAGSAAPATPAPGLTAGAAPAYPCCDDCGRQPPCDRHCPYAFGAEHRFDFDQASFIEAIEPPPLFLQRRTTAEDIEKLLELARAEDWPAPPRRMVG